MSIRNAPGQTSDGVFSAIPNSPCGGQNDWGRRNLRRYTYVVDGQRVCARVNWNGGHMTTKNENKLRAYFRCNRPSDAQDFLALSPIPLSDGTSPAPDNSGLYVDGTAVNTRYEGYTVCIDLPIQNIDASWSENDIRRQCTFAVAEGNTWGGCIDLMVSHASTTPVLTPAPVLTPEEFAVIQAQPKDLSASAGTYRIVNCFSDTGGKCCLTGYFAIREDGALSARFYGSSGFDNCFYLAFQYLDYQSILKPSIYARDTFTTNLYLNMGWDTFGRPVSQQNMSITIKQGGTMIISNVGIDIPEVSDHDAVYFCSLQNGLNLGYIPYPIYSEQADNFPYGLVIGCGFAALVLIYLVLGVCLSVVCGGPCHHPHIHWCLVGLGCVRRRRRVNIEQKGDVEGGDRESTAMTERESTRKSARQSKAFLLQLPPNWASAVDQTSGEVYYYNTKTRESTWDRPTI